MCKWYSVDVKLVMFVSRNDSHTDSRVQYHCQKSTGGQYVSAAEINVDPAAEDIVETG